MDSSSQQIIRWIAWAERSLAGLAISEGLHIGLAQAIQGPMVVTFRLRLLTPSKTALSKLLALGPTVQQALQSSPFLAMIRKRALPGLFLLAMARSRLLMAWLFPLPDGPTANK